MSTVIEKIKNYYKEIKGIFEHQEKRKNMVSKNVDKYDRLSSSLSVFKLCLMIEAKIITLSDMLIDIPRRNTQYNNNIIKIA